MRWQAFGASVAGVSHQDSARPCEDAFASDITADRVILAVADGAGSALRGRRGADIVSQGFVRGAAAKLGTGPVPGDPDAWREWAADLVASVRARLETVAYRLSIRQERYARDPARSEHEISAVAQDVLDGGDLERQKESPTPPGRTAVPGGAHDPDAGTGHRPYPFEEVVLWPSSPGLPDEASDKSNEARKARPHPQEEGRRQPPPRLRDFASTLVGVVLTKDWLIGVHIGDGLAVARIGDGAYKALTLPDKGEYVNETTFVTSAAYKRSLRIVVEPAHAVSGLALMSDGLERLAFDFTKNEPHGPFFDGIFRFGQQNGEDLRQKEKLLAEDLDSDAVNQRTDDDKTLLVAFPSGGKAGEALLVQGDE